ncbi:MAG TPA: hypothetical protein PLB90_09400 [Opitutaceae bacterium]|nr:hypothetical protein [Opitutaceae bacterium]
MTSPPAISVDALQDECPPGASLMVKLLCFLLVGVFVACEPAAASPPVPSTVMLVLPEGFRGDIFIIEHGATGQNWKKGTLVVPPSGIVMVDDLVRLSEITPDNFQARYLNGKEIGNSVLHSGREISLWPIIYIENEFLYFVVGTFHEKTMRENEKMRRGWRTVPTQVKGMRD